MLLGLGGVAVGVYGVLDVTAPALLQVPALGFGVVVGLVGFVLSGRSVRRSIYQPDRWRVAELVTVAAGVLAATVVVVASAQDPVPLFPSASPPEWPVLPVLPTLGVLLALLPTVATPPPPRLAPGVRPAEPAPALREAPA